MELAKVRLDGVGVELAKTPDLGTRPILSGLHEIRSGAARLRHEVAEGQDLRFDHEVDEGSFVVGDHPLFDERWFEVVESLHCADQDLARKLWLGVEQRRELPAVQH